MSDELSLTSGNPEVEIGEWRMSSCIKELASALSKTQANVKGAAKDSFNPHYKSQYSDLSSVWDACREPLTSNGLSVVQMPDKRGQEVGVSTLLMHSSGQWISCRTAAVPAKQDPQGVGSTITYLRRYSLSSVVGVCSVDDDAESAVPFHSTLEKASVTPKEAAEIVQIKAPLAVREEKFSHWKTKIDGAKNKSDMDKLRIEFRALEKDPILVSMVKDAYDKKMTSINEVSK